MEEINGLVAMDILMFALLNWPSEKWEICKIGGKMTHLNHRYNDITLISLPLSHMRAHGITMVVLTSAILINEFIHCMGKGSASWFVLVIQVFSAHNCEPKNCCHIVDARSRLLNLNNFILREIKLLNFSMIYFCCRRFLKHANSLRILKELNPER